MSWSPERSWSAFAGVMLGIGTVYVLLIVLMLLADISWITLDDLIRAWGQREIRYAAALTVVTSVIAASMSVWIAVPLAYVLVRKQFPGRAFGLALVDVPIVLPPIVVGISLLVMMRTAPGRWLESLAGDVFSAIGLPEITGITFDIPAIILAQFTVAAAFATRTLMVAIEQTDPRFEGIARSLGASDFQAFSRILLPQLRGGIVAAFTIAWARSIGEFGPILVFAGTTRMRTEVLSTSIYLELASGDFSAAVAVSLGLVALAMTTLILTRIIGRHWG